MSTYDATALYQEIAQAVEGGNLKSLCKIIKNQSKSRKREDVLADALVVSCEKRCHAITHHLLAKEKANPNLSSERSEQIKGVPPLILAADNFQTAIQQKNQPGSNQVLKHIKIIESLLSQGASLTACDPDGRNVLFRITDGRIAELLLAARAGPKRAELQEALASKDDLGNDALMSAILRKCDFSVFLSLIKYGADIQTTDKLHCTTLMNALQKNRADVVERLLKDKSLAGLKDKRGRNIWHHLALDNTHVRDEKLIKLLLTIDESDASGNDVDDQERTPLHWSSISGTLGVARALLKSRGVEVNAVEPNENKTALHLAAAYGRSAMIQLLIDHNAERTALCDGNLIPLHLACGCETEDVDAVKKLLAKKAEAQLNARTEDSMTPLHIAAAHGHSSIVKTLLEAPGSPNVNAHCQGGWTALHLACGRRLTDHRRTDPTRADAQEHKYLAVVETLLSAGSEVNNKSQTSRTALHLAVEFGHVEIVRLLLAQKDVQFAAKDSSGNTPLLDAAKSEQSNKILPLLAPWTEQSIEALPEDIKQSARDFDANVIDFQKFANAQSAKPRRHKISVFDLLYTPISKPGAISKKHVSTRPDPANERGFRWIHLPANNLHWCHTLLTKHFIEGGFADVDGFKDLEKSLSQHQYRGRKMHSQFMRPTCSAPSRQSGAQSHNHTDATCGSLHGFSNLLVRVNTASSAEVKEPDSTPPDPGVYTSLTDKDMTSSHLQLNRSESGDIQSRIPTQLPSRTEDRTAISQARDVSWTCDHFPSEMKMEPPNFSDSTLVDSLRAFLFLPFLALESRTSVDAMHERLLSKSSKARGNPIGRSERKITPIPVDDRDIRLHQAYFDWKANEYGLHIRRTLDQFFYRNVDTSQRDGDQVILRYQQKDNRNSQLAEDLNENVDVLMVDQLWIWVLGPELIMTSFPQKWEQPRKELPDLLSNVLEKIDPRTGDPVQSIYGLAACIVGQCMSACDRASYQSHKASVLDMFSGSVGDVMNEEVKLFSRFEKASVIASRWVKRTLRNNSVEHSTERHNLETEYDQDLLSVCSKNTEPDNTEPESRKDTDEPSFVEDLLDIQHETKLLEEVKDIRDELGILLRVVKDQQVVHEEILETFGSALKQGSNFSDQEKIGTILGEQSFSLDQQKIEIGNMGEQVGSVYNSITDLLDHKQKHANAIEARYARKQASDTAKAGRTLMVFTTVTVIFLPLSFLAAFFAINIRELPHNKQNEQQMSLGFVMRNVIGVGLGTALAFVIMAWHYHRVVPWGHKIWKWLKGRGLFIRPHTYELWRDITSCFMMQDRKDSTKGIENPMLAKRFLADSDPGRLIRKNRAKHDEEQGIDDSM